MHFVNDNGISKFLILTEIRKVRGNLNSTELFFTSPKFIQLEKMECVIFLLPFCLDENGTF